MALWPYRFTRRSQQDKVAIPGAEIKASAANLLAFPTGGLPRWTPRDYASLAVEGYGQNPVVYRCVRMVSEAAASVPWLLYDGARELDDHPFLSLLARPNIHQIGADLLEAWYGHLLIAGNAYFELAGGATDLAELYVLRPDRMKVVPGNDGWPTGFDYVVNGQTQRFALAGKPDGGASSTSPIHHMALFHPTDDHYGLSPIEAAASAIDIHNAATAWNKALLDNSARPSGAIVYAGAGGATHLSEDQFVRLKAELESAYQGAKNAGRPMLLEGGLDWKAMSMSPKDMDFIELKHVAAREIALAFGVPPMLLGIPGDNTFANYREANRTFWRQTVLPLIGRTAKSLTRWLGPVYGEDLRLWFDADRIEALSTEREALWTRIGAAEFLTVDEKRAALGYSPIADAKSGLPKGAGQ